MKYTFGLIKSHAVQENKIGGIISLIENHPDLWVVRMSRVQLTREQAEEFYAEHKGKPFFDRVCNSVTSGPVYALMLESAFDAISAWRQLMGATDPEQAQPGTVRGDFGTQLPFNAVHGADSPTAAVREAQIIWKESAQA